MLEKNIVQFRRCDDVIDHLLIFSRVTHHVLLLKKFISARATAEICAFPDVLLQENSSLSSVYSAVESRAIMRDWHPIANAPFDRDLHLSVIENDQVHALVFPCRRTQYGWKHAATGEHLPIDPTHWREWSE